MRRSLCASPLLRPFELDSGEIPAERLVCWPAHKCGCNSWKIGDMRIRLSRDETFASVHDIRHSQLRSAATAAVSTEQT